MKCPNCGGEITGNNKVCEYCGSQISHEMRKEQEQVNKAGCPKCGSTNISFSRETTGAQTGKEGVAVLRETVGLCKDCGYTWTTSQTPKTTKRRTWLWVLGWICIFPVPLTILMLRNKEMKPALRYSIIVIGWIAYFLIGIYGNATESTTGNNSSAVPTVRFETIITLNNGNLYANEVA